MQDNAEEIIEEIRAAFAGVPRGKITIHEAEVIDSYGDDGARDRARLLDTESSWEQIPDSHVEECSWALCHLDPVSWRYYIPKYMLWALRNFKTNNSIVTDFTIYTFDVSSSDAGVREYKQERYRLLNPFQSWAVCRFLRHMVANEDHADGSVARRALEDYWGQFCDERSAENS